LYVALTRAMFRLYVPLLNSNHNQHGGPACNVLAKVLGQATLEEIGKPYVAVVTPLTLTPGEAAVSAGLGRGESQPASARSWDTAAPALPAPLQRKLPADLDRRRIRTYSFSSLHRAEGRRWHEPDQFGERRPRAGDEDSDSAEDPLRGPVLGE